MIGNCTVQGVCEIVGLLKQIADLTDVVTADSNRRAFCRRVRIYWVRLDPQARMGFAFMPFRNHSWRDLATLGVFPHTLQS